MDAAPIPDQPPLFPFSWRGVLQPREPSQRDGNRATVVQSNGQAVFRNFYVHGLGYAHFGENLAGPLSDYNAA